MSIFNFFPAQASTNAGQVDALYLYLVGISTLMVFLIFVLVLVFAVKYRRRSPNDPAPRSIHGSVPLEITWSVIPFLAMLVMFAWGTKLYFGNYVPPKNAMDVYVTGKQWMWKVQYPNGAREIDSMHVPVGVPVKLTLASEDVIHSFYIPSFRLKHDVVPGSYQTYWFEATEVGKYHIFCAEYCGTDHSKMTGWVTVMDPQDFQTWLASSATSGTMAQQGEKLFAEYGCATCHMLDQQGRYPSLSNVYGHPVQLEDGRTVIADATYLRESILNPNAKIVKGYHGNVMPIFQGQIGEEGLLSLIAYIKSLALPPPAAPGATASAARQ